MLKIASTRDSRSKARRSFKQWKAFFKAQKSFSFAVVEKRKSFCKSFCFGKPTTCLPAAKHSLQVHSFLQEAFSSIAKFFSSIAKLLNASSLRPSKYPTDIIVYSYVFACRTIKSIRNRSYPLDVQFPVHRWWIAWKTIRRCWEIFYIAKYILCNTTLMTINRHWKGWNKSLYRVTLIDEHSPLSFQVLPTPGRVCSWQRFLCGIVCMLINMQAFPSFIVQHLKSFKLCKTAAK